MTEYYGETVPFEVERIPDRSSADDPESGLQASLLYEHIQQLLDRLPARQRSVFILRFYQDMPLREIGAVLKLSEGTVKSHLFRTIRKLRTYLKPFEADVKAGQGRMR